MKGVAYALLGALGFASCVVSDFELVDSLGDSGKGGASGATNAGEGGEGKGGSSDEKSASPEIDDELAALKKKIRIG